MNDIPLIALADLEGVHIAASGAGGSVRPPDILKEIPALVVTRESVNQRNEVHNESGSQK